MACRNTASCWCAAVPRGEMEPTLRGRDGFLHRYVLLVPEDYDPSRRWPVRVFLHGGTTQRSQPGPQDTWWPDLDLVRSERYISVVPDAWNTSLWWQGGQVDALHDILADVKRVFNVDENRVYVCGFSDGGGGTYFLGYRDTTPWAAFLPLIGNPGVLRNSRYAPEGRTDAANLLNKPLFIVNARDDLTHPWKKVEPWIRQLRSAGVDFEFHMEDGGHDIRWWKQEEPSMDRFIAEHPRDPLPDTVIWATDRTDRYNRAAWLVIEELGRLPTDPRHRDLAALTADGKAGVVRVVRGGNTYTAEAYGVRRFRILLSPDEVDLSRPIRVVVNGVERFNGVVAPDERTLLEWAAVDLDRTMLFASEVTIDVAP